MPLPARRRSPDEDPDAAAAAAADAPPDTPADEANPPAQDRGRGRVTAETPAPARRRRSSTGDGVKRLLTVVYRIARLAFLLLALACALGIVFVLAPTNDDNSVVQLVSDVAEGAAGPFKDVFTDDDRDRELVINYGFATLVYLAAAALVTRLPGTKR